MTHHHGLKVISLLFMFCLLFFPAVYSRVIAAIDSYVLETEQHWDTFGVGGTCISGSHNLAVSDVDGDCTKEMITGGSSYNFLPDGSRANRWAPLKIWSWNGANLTLETNYSWTGNIGCVFAGDVDKDGKTEILTSGNTINESGNTPSLRIWNKDTETLVLRGNYEGTNVGSISVGDADGDGKSEIITISGRSSIQSMAQLSVFHWDGISLTLSTSADCCATKDARSNSVCVHDLDNDGIIEIVTAGYANNLTNSKGQLRVWQFDGKTLSLKHSAQWCLVDGTYSVDVAGNVMGNTVVSKVSVSDIDGDGVPELVTGGFTYDGAAVEAQIRIWNWSGEALNLEKSQEWKTLDITQVTSLSIDDVDGDGKKEVVTSGVTAGYGSWAQNAPDKERAELKVWSWDGSVISLEREGTWIVGEGVCAWNVGTGDVDNDGVVEIITVGCMYTGNMCDPDLRIWSLHASSVFPLSSLLILSVAIAGAAATAIALTIFTISRKGRRSAGHEGNPNSAAFAGHE